MKCPKYASFTLQTPERIYNNKGVFLKYISKGFSALLDGEEREG